MRHAPLMIFAGRHCRQCGARDLLLAIGQWRSVEEEDGDEEDRSPLEINPFSKQVLEEAHCVSEATLKRREQYNKLPPLSVNKESRRQARSHELWAPFRLPELRGATGGCDVRLVWCGG